jgi:hypothetical protein
MNREDIPPMQYMRHLLATLVYRRTFWAIRVF